MPEKKTWIDKLNEAKAPKVKRLDIDFADLKAGSQMFIATPQLVEQYLRETEPGQTVNVKVLRKDLATAHRADNTCPVTTGVFLRIVAEANYDKWLEGAPVESIAPFWRVIAADSALAKKLRCGSAFIEEQLARERG